MCPLGGRTGGHLTGPSFGEAPSLCLVCANDTGLTRGPLLTMGGSSLKPTVLDCMLENFKKAFSGDYGIKTCPGKLGILCELEYYIMEYYIISHIM